MSLIRKHGAVLQAWACLDLVFARYRTLASLSSGPNKIRYTYISIVNGGRSQ